MKLMRESLVGSTFCVSSYIKAKKVILPNSMQRATDASVGIFEALPHGSLPLVNFPPSFIKIKFTDNSVNLKDTT